MDIISIPLSKLRPDPNQPRKRFDTKSLAEIADSLSRVGLLNPIIVTMRGSGAYQIVAGERRYRAAKKLGWKNIDAIITEEDPEEVALIDNIQREDLHPIEEAEAYQHLCDRKAYTHEQLATIVSKSRTAVTKILKLAKLDAKIKEESLSDYPDISKSVLLEIAQADPAVQLDYWAKAKAGATVRQLRQTQPSSPKPPLAAALRTGRAFLKQLGAITDVDLAGADAHYTRLLRLYNDVATQMRRLEDQVS